MGTALEAAIPFAAGHEIIRQRIPDLTLIGPISDVLFDQLIGAGCVARFVGAWVGNVSSGLGHNYRRAAEQGIPRAIAVEDHSNFTIALALLAASLGAPYIPTRSLLGTSFLDSNPHFTRTTDPYSDDPIVLVPAITPDVTILQVQRADVYGRCHLWGTVGISREAAFAARRVIVVAEEIWPTERILADPNLILVHLPIHASWLNQIEIYFSILQRKVLTPNDFADCAAVETRLQAFAARQNARAKPFRWQFTRADLERRLQEQEATHAQEAAA